MVLKIGLIVGREWSFPPAFIEEVNRRDEGVIAEYVTLGGTRMDEPCEYAVIIDRISHEVPYYRSYLKQAALQGATIVNNPFMWTADDKLFEAALATSLGIASPKTLALPNKEYVPGINHDESLRNLAYPLDWDRIIDYIGLPCILKDAHGGGWRDVYVCHTIEEVWEHYNNSGLLTMILQEFIEWEQFVRCIVLGQENVLPIRYDPSERKYHVDHDHLTPELGQRIVDESLKLCRALGYDMNSMEWAIRDGVPYAIDFMNPAPDMDINSLAPHYFEWAVKGMADMAITLAKAPRPQAAAMRWDGFFAGRNAVPATVSAATPATTAPSTPPARALGPSDSAPPESTGTTASVPAAVRATGATPAAALGPADSAPPEGAMPPASAPAATAGVPEEASAAPPKRRRKATAIATAEDAPAGEGMAPKAPSRREKTT
jgi:hypothetical protein